MTIQVEIFSLSSDPSRPQRVASMELQGIPNAGDFIYRHDGMQAPHEVMFKVVQVLHDVSVGSPKIEVYVLHSDKMEFRQALIEAASRLG